MINLINSVLKGVKLWRANRYLVKELGVTKVSLKASIMYEIRQARIRRVLADTRALMNEAFRRILSIISK